MPRGKVAAVILHQHIVSGDNPLPSAHLYGSDSKGDISHLGFDTTAANTAGGGLGVCVWGGAAWAE